MRGTDSLATRGPPASVVAGAAGIAEGPGWGSMGAGSPPELGLGEIRGVLGLPEGVGLLGSGPATVVGSPATGVLAYLCVCKRLDAWRERLEPGLGACGSRSVGAFPDSVTRLTRSSPGFDWPRFNRKRLASADPKAGWLDGRSVPNDHPPHAKGERLRGPSMSGTGEQRRDQVRKASVTPYRSCTYGSGPRPRKTGVGPFRTIPSGKDGPSWEALSSQSLEREEASVLRWPRLHNH